MKNWKQMALSALVVVAALAVVGLTLGNGETAQGVGGMQGHNHAAMGSGSAEQKPVRLAAEDLAGNEAKKAFRLFVRRR